MPKYEKYALSKKTRESKTAWTLEFSPKEGEVFSYKPGQFAILKNIHVPAEIKHNFRSYSILHPFDGKRICFGIKVEGEFTSALASLEEGSEVEISGPYGLFGLPEENISKYIFLAGGVGITPLLCMIEGLLRKNSAKKICLFYSNKYLEEVAYKKLLDEYSAKYSNFRVIYSITRECPPGVECESGHIDFNVIKKHCPKIEGAHFFICGSKGFADALSSQLLEGGVGKERVHCEKW